MKWFVATNQASLANDQFFDLLLVALRTAQHNTTLKPWLLYDGGDCPRLKLLRDLGFEVICHELSFKPILREWILSRLDAEMFTIRAGAFLRCELPLVLERVGIKDQFVLYTDADVMFLRECDFDGIHPRHFAALGHKTGGRTRFRIGGWYHYNTGVMVLNVPAMREETKEFIDFILNNGYKTKRPNDSFMHKNLFLSDQVALNLYYRGRIDNLSARFNWHPSRGVNPSAAIIHFNGLKWTQWEDFLAKRLRPDRQEKFTKLVRRNPAGYEHYVGLAKSFAGETEIN